MSQSLRFLRRGPISPAVHGTLDYLLAATLIVAPLVLHYHDETAKVIMLVLGGAATVLAVGTNWSRGIIRVLPPVVHGVADIGATIALMSHRSSSASATTPSRSSSTSSSAPADCSPRC